MDTLVRQTEPKLLPSDTFPGLNQYMPKMRFRGSQHSSDPLAEFKEQLMGRGKEWKAKKGERKGKWKGNREIRDMKKEVEETGRNEIG